MRYHVRFVNDAVGRSTLPPFDVETPEQLSVGARSADLSRLIRRRIVEALASAPAPGAVDARGVIAQHTQVVVMLSANQGSAYYGTTTLGRFDLFPVP